MLRQNPSGIDPEQNRPNQFSPDGPEGLDLQRQLQRLEEIIVLDGLKLPLTRRTVVDEEQLLAQLLRVERSIPEAVQEAEEILLTRDEILARANAYAQELIKSAEQQAAKIADEIRIVQQAEREAQQLRQQVKEETETLRQQNFTEIERIRRQAQQELEEMRQVTLAECQQIQAGADTYAERVLTDLERQMGELLRVIHNGRQHIRQHQAPPQAHPPQRR